MLCLIPELYSESVTVVDAVVTVEKPSMFFARLFQTACGNHQENIAEGFLCRFPQLWQFPPRFPDGGFFFQRRENHSKPATLCIGGETDRRL